MQSKYNNEAAWITEERARPLKVGPGPQPNPAENEVVIKVAYAAVNPTDWKMQSEPYFELPYPWIFGTDCAGTVVQIGSSVTRFKIGQRVIGHCDSLLTRKVSNSGFQLYSTCRELLVSTVPDDLPLANAAVLPLSVSTAASGLFVELGLPFPSLDPQPTGKTILIWGGSSSCGSSAIQLAVAAGLTVATTASKKNEAFVRDLGASMVFDYNDHDVAEKIVEELKPGDVVFDCISDSGTQLACGKILGEIGGGKLPMLLGPSASLPENVQAAFVNGLAPGISAPDVGEAVWGKYLFEALNAGKFKAKPDPLILEGGLKRVQEGLDMQREGVSAKKIVIEVCPE